MKRIFQWLFYHHSSASPVRGKRMALDLLHDLVILVLLFLAAILLCDALSNIYDDNNQFAVPVFILVVALIARFTHGYLFGFAASLIGVFCVNYIFTYPYWEFDLTLTGYPLTFAAMLMVSLCVSTLTTRIKLADQLRHEAEMEKMRANLLRSVSHDLRTPLTSIVGSSSVLLENDALTREERVDLIYEINKDARWLARITENLLSITKFSGAQVHLNKEYEVVEEIVSSAIVKFRRNHPEIRVNVRKPEEILLAPMDAILIEQVLQNLFDNAVMHGKTTSTISIGISEIENQVMISVSDDGEGISEQVFPHLFDGLASGYSSKSDDHRNMGIGLSVCQSIIRAHGGTISAYNNKHGGASFEIRLHAGEDTDYE